MKKIILASGSSRRKELLDKLELQFEVMPSAYEEDMTLNLNPIELAKHLSLGKAKYVAEKKHNAIVIGADTLIAFEGKVLGKPKSREAAVEMLMAFSGKMHTVITGLTVINTVNLASRIVSNAFETKVYFRSLTKSEVENYIDTNDVLDKAGAYAIQDKGFMLIEKIDGDYYNMVGLPMGELVLVLREFGIEV